MYDCNTASPQVPLIYHRGKSEISTVFLYHLHFSTFITSVPLNTGTLTEKLIYAFSPA